MRQVTSNVYQFDELSDKAKERAREWWRECETQEFGGFNEAHELAELPAKLLTVLQKQHGYALTAKVSIRSGHYVHKHMMDADVYLGDNEADSDTAEAVLELMRDFAEWIYRGLETEYEYRMSDENVDDSITANEYEFTEDGERA